MTSNQAGKLVSITGMPFFGSDQHPKLKFLRRILAMRNFKKLSALVVAIALVLTSIVPAFAYTPVNADKAEILRQLEIYQGISTDSFVPALDQDLTRGQGALLLARLFNKEADIEKMTDAEVEEVLKSFADGSKVPAYVKKAVAYFVDNKVINGSLNNGELTIDEAGSLYAEQFAALILRQMGYQDSHYTKAIEELAAVEGVAGLDSYTSIAGSEIKRDHAVGIMYGSLTGKYEGEDATVIAKIVEAKPALREVAEKHGLIEAEVKALAVESVTADNLRALKIALNKAINPTTATTSTVKVTAGGNNKVAEVKVSEDNKTIVVIFNGMAQSTTVDIAIDGVKTTAGEELKGYTSSKAITDTTIPEAIGATTLNAKQVEVFFNEPINFTVAGFQVLNNIKIDGVATIAKATPNDVTNSVVFEFPSAIAAGTHTISVADMVDYAGYKAVTKEFSFTVAEDKVAPVIVDAVAKSVSSIEVTFDEKVEVIGTIKVNGVEATTIAPVSDSNGTKFLLSGGFTNLDLSAIVEVKIEYKDQADVAGNKVSEAKTFTFKVADDTTLPTVSYTIADGNKVTLTFSKSMNTTLGTITVKNSEKTQLAQVNVSDLTFKSDSNNTVLELEAATLGLNDINPENVTIEIKDMKDATIRANLLPTTTLTVAAKDTKKPKVDDNYFVSAGTTAKEDTITFYFSEAMDVDTMKNLSNYIGEETGSLAAANATVKSVATDAKSIVIQLEGIASTSQKFTVAAIKDVAGNFMITNHEVIKLEATTLNAVGSETTDGTKITVTFDTKIESVDPSGLKIMKDGSDYAVFVNATIDEDGKKVTFTSNKSLGTSTTGYTLATNNKNLVKNIYGAELNVVDGLAIADKVKATVTVATDDTTGIKITFSEQVKAESEAALLNDLIIRDKDGKIVEAITIAYTANDAEASVSGFDKIVISGTGITAGESYTVSLISRGVTDISTNANLVVDVAPVTVVAK